MIIFYCTFKDGSSKRFYLISFIFHHNYFVLKSIDGNLFKIFLIDVLDFYVGYEKK